VSARSDIISLLASGFLGSIQVAVDRPYQEQSTLGFKYQDSSYPVTAQTGQLLLHGVVHEMNESGQWIFGAATRAAEKYQPSRPFQCQGREAILTYGLFCHGVLLGFKPNTFFHRINEVGVIMQTGAFYAICQRFARAVNAFRRLTTGDI
jgi:hypothetical protein